MPIGAKKMDLISTLAGQLGVNPDQAQALAGSVLGGVTNSVKDEFGDEAGGQMESAVPELGDWKAKAASMLGGDDDKQESSGGLGGLLGGSAGGLLGGGAGGLLGAAAGALGGDGMKDIAAVASLVSKLGIDPAKATMIAPVVLDFLKKRVDEDLLAKVLKAAPLLSGVGGGGEPDAGVGGMIGSLFG
jgi:hypothetical protein